MGKKRAFQAQEIGQAKCRGREIAQGWDPGVNVREQVRERRGYKDFRDFLDWLITCKATYPKGTTDAQLDP